LFDDISHREEKSMFERYTEKARRAVFWARYIASQGGSREIETEHLLLGLLREDPFLALRFLGSPSALNAVWREAGQREVIREKRPDIGDHLPISNEGKNVLVLAVEESNQLSNKHIGTEHLLLGILRYEKCFATQILHEHGVRLDSTRKDLARMPHDDLVTEAFVKERSSLPEVVELQTRIGLIVSRMKDAVANRDFAAARAYSTEERTERDKLYLLCQQHGLLDWLYD
jgi:ATP-dependent Clp protease ATP-binding subunit ClpC